MHDVSKPTKMGLTKVNDIVLDPFAGSSTTGVASLKNKRKFIGIDLVDFNINFGKKRMEHFLKTGECYIPKNKLEELEIDVNYYKIKGKHVNNPWQNDIILSNGIYFVKYEIIK